MGEALIGDRVAILAGGVAFVLLLVGSGFRPSPMTEALAVSDPAVAERVRRNRLVARVLLGAGCAAAAVFVWAVLFLPMAGSS